MTSRGAACGFQQANEFVQLLFPQMAQQPAVTLLNRTIQLSQNPKTRRGDACDYHPPIVRTPASDPPAPLQTSNKAGNVRIAGDHAFSDFAACQPVRLRAPQDPQGIVLRRGEPVLLEQLGNPPGQAVSGTLQHYERFFLQAEARLGFSGFALLSHRATMYTL